MTQFAYATALSGNAPLSASATVPALRRAGRSLWLALCDMGEARARRELQRQAIQRESANPEQARLLRRTAHALG